ncbi:MAG: hypothetical protein VX777_06925 [Chlamydiota bacterium]|nr:hypothetical protein [Chlamydiota bacterium]
MSSLSLFFSTEALGSYWGSFVELPPVTSLVNFFYQEKAQDFKYAASIIDGSVRSIEKGKVVFLPETHSKIEDKIFQKTVLTEYFNPLKDVLLIEEPSCYSGAENQVLLNPDNSRWRESFPTVRIFGWDDKDIEQNVELAKRHKKIQQINDAIITIQGSFLPGYLYNETLLKSYKHLISQARDCEKNENLFSEIQWEEKIRKGEYNNAAVIELLKKIDLMLPKIKKSIIFEEINMPRQQSLIQSIERLVNDSKVDRIFVISGLQHIDTRPEGNQPLREGALKVTNTLKERAISYITLSLEA